MTVRSASVRVEASGDSSFESDSSALSFNCRFESGADGDSDGGGSFGLRAGATGAAAPRTNSA